MGHHPEREYGLGDSTGMVRGIPRVKGRTQTSLACPICGCDTLYDIEVDVKCELLVGGKGLGFYAGCPACPFATPMMMIAAPDES